MTGVALPSIRTDLDMSTSSLQWVVSAYVLGYAGSSGSPQALLDGFHAAIVVSLIVAALGVAAVTLRRRAQVVPCPEPGVPCPEPA
jgi:hypothetical protein